MTSDHATGSGTAAREANRATVHRALAAISRLDVPGALAEIHPGLVFDLPYEKVVPTLDRAGFGTLLAGLAADFERFTMTVVEELPGLDPDVLVLRYAGDCLSRDGTVSYRNDYIAVLGFTGGMISRWREYANPVLTRRMHEQLTAARAASAPGTAR